MYMEKTTETVTSRTVFMFSLHGDMCCTADRIVMSECQTKDLHSRFLIHSLQSFEPVFL